MMLILLIPLVAMLFTNEVNWTISDFIISSFLLLSTGIIFHFTIRKVRSFRYRVVISIALLLILLMIWAELAVGIFDTPFSGS